MRLTAFKGVSPLLEGVFCVHKKMRCIVLLHRFSRTELIIGKSGLERLAHAQVAVFGIGGVGGTAAEALARSGVGRLVLIDYDDVCLTNINRQVIALQSTVGQAKVDVMQERIKAINPKCEVIVYKEFYKPERAHYLLQPDYSYVLDAIDTVSAKLDLLERCYRQGIPVISAMGAGNKLDPTKLEVVDISKTHTCPLAKVVRKELRKRWISKGIQTVFSTELPLPIQADATNCKESCICPNKDQLEFVCTKRRSIPGSSAVVPPVAGYLMASVVIRDILGM